MSNVVVTGAGGFIGAALVKRLLADGVAGAPVKSLVAVDLQLDALPADPRIVRVQGSIADPALLQRLGEQPLDVVFHLASVPGVPPSAIPPWGAASTSTPPPTGCSGWAAMYRVPASSMPAPSPSMANR